ncbi:MAG: phosphoribosylanthranilate isomerase [Sulfuritalea sp.]|jgi:phosphoribosylanthranilate isomerase|nr:phosphoribosylanthranilate isomerase [Sulfuritalea sp.]
MNKPMTRTRIKICGITREEDLVAAVAAGADALGFVFYPPSPRYVTPQRAAELLAGMPAFVTRVGLFVNESAETVRGVLARAPLDLLQFHGDEDAAYCAGFGKPWIKAARMRAGFDLLEYAAAFAGAPEVCGLLLDAHVEGYGGGGQTFDWSLIPRSLPLPVILSGGLHPGNVNEAVRAVRPWAVDVSSGVEAARGIKDVRKIDEFIAGVRDADAGHAV